MEGLGKAGIGAVLGVLVGGLSVTRFVEEKAKEEQEHSSRLETHEEKLNDLKEKSFYSRGDRDSMELRIRALELRAARRDGSNS